MVFCHIMNHPFMDTDHQTLFQKRWQFASILWITLLRTSTTKLLTPPKFKLYISILIKTY